MFDCSLKLAFEVSHFNHKFFVDDRLVDINGILDRYFNWHLYSFFYFDRRTLNVHGLVNVYGLLDYLRDFYLDSLDDLLLDLLDDLDWHFFLNLYIFWHLHDFLDYPFRARYHLRNLHNHFHRLLDNHLFYNFCGNTRF